MADESKIIKVGTAPKVVPDDISRDIAMSRNPRNVHKVPQSITRSDDLYFGGHPVFRTQPSGVGSVSVSFTDTDDSHSAASAIQNDDLSAYIPQGLKPSGAIVKYIVDIYVQTVKVQAGTTAYARIFYSLKYDTAPGADNEFGGLLATSQSQDADDQSLIYRVISQAMIPIVYHNNVPYITWTLWGQWTFMTAVSGIYRVTCSLSLAGFLL